MSKVGPGKCFKCNTNMEQNVMLQHCLECVYTHTDFCLVGLHANTNEHCYWLLLLCTTNTTLYHLDAFMRKIWLNDGKEHKAVFDRPRTMTLHEMLVEFESDINYILDDGEMTIPMAVINKSFNCEIADRPVEISVIAQNNPITYTCSKATKTKKCSNAATHFKCTDKKYEFRCTKCVGKNTTGFTELFNSPRIGYNNYDGKTMPKMPLYKEVYGDDFKPNANCFEEVDDEKRREAHYNDMVRRFQEACEDDMRKSRLRREAEAREEMARLAKEEEEAESEDDETALRNFEAALHQHTQTYNAVNAIKQLQALAQQLEALRQPFGSVQITDVTDEEEEDDYEPVNTTYKDAYAEMIATFTKQQQEHMKNAEEARKWREEYERSEKQFAKEKSALDKKMAELKKKSAQLDTSSILDKKEPKTKVIKPKADKPTKAAKPKAAKPKNSAAAKPKPAKKTTTEAKPVKKTTKAKATA